MSSHQIYAATSARVSPTRRRHHHHHHHHRRRRRINDDDAKRRMSLSRRLLYDDFDERGRAARTVSTKASAFTIFDEQHQGSLLVEDARRAVDAFNVVDFDASTSSIDPTLGKGVVSTLVRHAMRAMAETHPVGVVSGGTFAAFIASAGSVSIAVIALALFTRRRSAAANRKDDELPKVYDDAQIAR